MCFFSLFIAPYRYNLITCFALRAQLGEAAKLKPLEIDLTRLEDLSDSIVQDFVHMRKQEEEMRDTNGTSHTHTRE